MARPPKYTTERAERVLEAIRAGATRRAAAGHAGVSEDTLQRWQRRSAAFAESLTRAEDDVEVKAVATIQHAWPEDWRAAAWWLEHRRPAEYRQRPADMETPTHVGVNVQIVERQVLIQQVAGALEDYPDARSTVLSLLQRNGHAEP